MPILEIIVIGFPVGHMTLQVQILGQVYNTMDEYY